MENFLYPGKAKNSNLRGIDVSSSGLKVRAGSIIETKQLIQSNVNHGDWQNLQIDVNSSSSQHVEQRYSSEDFTELNERERLRRMKISKANKGTPLGIKAGSTAQKLYNGSKREPGLLCRILRLLIAEAEKAANALEVAATRSPLAQASLDEARKLIAEAVESIESIESGQVHSHENGKSHCFTLTGPVNPFAVEKERDVEIKGLKPSRSERSKQNPHFNIK